MSMGKKRKSHEEIGGKILGALPTWSDKQTLQVFSLFLKRVNLYADFVGEGPDITGHRLICRCGDRAISTEVLEFELPLTMKPIPREKLN